MSINRIPLRLAAASAAAVVIVVAASAPASAHVTVTSSTTAAGGHAVATFAVPHGCEESPTTRVAIQIPEPLLSVTPTRHPLWDVKVVQTHLDEPAEDPYGNKVTSRVSEVVYRAREPLPHDVRDAFDLSFVVPETPGETLVFPVVQTCVKGETAWTEVPPPGEDSHDLEHPAPSFAVTAAEEHGEDAEAAAPDDAEAGQEQASVGSGDDGTGLYGLAAGLVGMVTGGLALSRVRRRT